MDTIRLLTHLGSIDESADSKYFIRINGKHLIFHKPHRKHLERSPHRNPPTVRNRWPPTRTGGCRHIYRSPRSTVVSDLPLVRSAGRNDQSVRSHHFLHHLHHRQELPEHGQRPREDLTFYDRIADALREADRIVLLCHGKGVSNASRFFAERLARYHPGIYARIVRQGEVNASAMTEEQILEFGRQALTATA